MLEVVGWSSREIRERCAEGTFREFQAYLAAGLILKPETPEIQQTMQSIAEEIMAGSGYTVAQLKGQQRHMPLMMLRTEFCYRASTELGKTSTQIARFLGNRDHSSVLYLLKYRGVPRKNGGRPAQHKTHCIHGHEFTPENTYVYKGRLRKHIGCKECKRATNARRNEKRKRDRAEARAIVASVCK